WSRWIFGKEVRRPKKEIPVVTLDRASFDTPPDDDLRITWMGHSSVLVEIDGRRILTDPIWSKRCSPSSLVGPSRFHPPPLSLDDLPPLDAVIVSHDHYDHLDKASVTVLARSGVRFVVPLGVGAHLERWGIESSQITELDWWSTTRVGHVEITALPGRHFSGRGLGSMATLWATWAIMGPEHRVFFSGDTGPLPGFEDIGEEYGPFDVTLMKIGAYDVAWPDIHLSPEQALDAHVSLGGRLLIPIHWGTFNLAFHDWFEPPERLVAEASRRSIGIAVPRPGQMVSPADPPPVDRWWME
ncbi:MAG: MBL fold metallo-hydrolase, partial [Deltaproteobacteria bacterium]|nr:MBL fold metallo-hydrolase [Deltaproteobacteria bacterium]